MEGRLSRTDGDVCETQAMIACERLGYQVIPAAAGNQRAWDLLVNGLRLQVKKRSVDATKPNNIRLVTSRSSSIVAYTTAEVDAFAIRWCDDWFVFLSVAIADASGAIKNGLWMPRVFHFRNNWAALGGSTIRCHVQRGFDFSSAVTEATNVT